MSSTQITALVYVHKLPLINELCARRYVQGPYYKDARYAHGGTPFDNLPDMVPEAGNVYGMWMPTLPPNARCVKSQCSSV